MKIGGFLAGMLAVAVSPCFAQGPTWTLKFPARYPPANAGVMAYDGVRQKLIQIIACGTGAGQQWSWDGSNWTEEFPATRVPVVSNGTMVFDSVRNEVVVFGPSNNCIAESNETWVWDGTNWAQRFPTSSPPIRSLAAGAYDAARHQFVLFGGKVEPGSVRLGDTWVWDGNNWTQKFPAHSPSPRSDAAMAYDAIRLQVVLFGGSPVVRGAPVADTWVWDGNDWTQILPSTHPAERASFLMAYDTVGQQILLFGGVGLPCSGSCTGSLGDTWVWDGKNWTQLFPASSPSPRVGWGNIAYDSARAQIVLFGGNVPFGQSYDDTWVWGSPFAAQVQPPINPDGSSVFNVKRGVAPVKFTLTENDSPTCNLPPATISLFRTSGGTPGMINESDYIMPADNGSNFRVSGCQYVYNLGTSLLGVGTYQVKISIGGFVVGTATFALN